MRIIIVALLVTMLCGPVHIDTAVIRSEKFDEQLEHMMLRNPGNIRILRSAAEGSDEEDVPIRNCYNTPCGWAVYDSFTRNVQYFMKNICECSDKSYKCVRASDDLSASAYVYRCRQNTTVEDIEPPEETN